MGNRVAPCTVISPERPLIILQTSNRFGDSDEGWGDHGNPIEEAAKHGRGADDTRKLRPGVDD